jgi:hypothetical protein
MKLWNLEEYCHSGVSVHGFYGLQEKAVYDVFSAPPQK